MTLINTYKRIYNSLSFYFTVFLYIDSAKNVVLPKYPIKFKDLPVVDLKELNSFAGKKHAIETFQHDFYNLTHKMFACINTPHVANNRLLTLVNKAEHLTTVVLNVDLDYILKVKISTYNLMLILSKETLTFNSSNFKTALDYFNAVRSSLFELKQTQNNYIHFGKRIIEINDTNLDELQHLNLLIELNDFFSVICYYGDIYHNYGALAYQNFGNTFFKNIADTIDNVAAKVSDITLFQRIHHSCSTEGFLFFLLTQYTFFVDNVILDSDFVAIFDAFLNSTIKNVVNEVCALTMETPPASISLPPADIPLPPADIPLPPADIPLPSAGIPLPNNNNNYIYNILSNPKIIIGLSIFTFLGAGYFLFTGVVVLPLVTS